VRAVAVLLVIANHAGVPGFAGGYVGVDVFFVVSGYVITQLLLRETDNGARRGLADFYSRRVRRIVPAATATLVATVVAAGLLPCFGLHHASAQNPFNLADDLIEPFRPFADRLVHTLAVENPPPTALTRAHRQTLAALLFADVTLGTETLTLLAATEKAAASLVRAMQSGRATLITLPSLAKPP
jgi:CRISPR-associated protein Cas1